jgi:predicted nucleic acid-binding protein
VYGAHRLEARTDALLERLEKTLLPNLPILPFDAAAANQYGKVRAQLERQGTPLGEADLRIAAVALAHGFTVITGNVRHFQRVPGLSVENWFEES